MYCGRRDGGGVDEVDTAVKRLEKVFMEHAGIVAHRCTCSSPLLCRTTLDSWERTVHFLPFTGHLRQTNLTHGIGIKTVEILHNAGHLSFQFELTALLKVQARRVDYRKQQPVETRFVNIDRSRLNPGGRLDTAAHEAVK